MSIIHKIPQKFLFIRRLFLKGTRVRSDETLIQKNMTIADGIEIVIEDGGELLLI